MRELKFCMMLLEDENEQLHNDLDEKNAQADELEEKLDRTFAQVAEKEAEVQHISHELRLKVREFDAAKVRSRDALHLHIPADPISDSTGINGAPFLRFQQDPHRKACARPGAVCFEART